MTLKHALLYSAVAGCLWGCGGSASSPHQNEAPRAPAVYVMPELAPPRRKFDLFYFCAVNGQPTDHVNRFMEAFWGSDEDGVARIKDAGLRTSIAVGDFVFVKGAYVGTERLLALVEKLKAAEVMGLIDVVFLVDEPELAGISEEEIFKAIDGVKAVFELRALPIHINWGGTETYPGLSRVDIGSFDAYGVDIFSSGLLARFISKLAPWQKYALVAGSADPWRNDLAPFYAMANNDEKCFGIMVFVYFDFEFEGPQKGVGTNGLLPMVAGYGTAIKGVA